LRGVVKGTAFEIEVSITLSNLQGFVEVRNLQVYSHFLKKPTEIDRLILSPWGLFSIEAKSFTNYLRGEYEDKNWVGTTGQTNTVIFNPVVQNYEHIRSLKNALCPIIGEYVRIENLVVAPDSCNIISNFEGAMNLSNMTNLLARRALGKPTVHNLSDIARAIDLARVR